MDSLPAYAATCASAVELAYPRLYPEAGLVGLQLELEGESLADRLSVEIDPDAVKGQLAQHIREAWETLFSGIVYPQTSIPVHVIAECGSAQMTPLLTHEGLRCMLDLGIAYGLEGELMRSLIWHELYHLHDRLREDFQVDYYFDATLKGDRRRTVNAMWDIFIESRKWLIYSITPWTHLDHNRPKKGDYERDTVRHWLDGIFPTAPLAWLDEVMARFWRQEGVTYGALVAAMEEADERGNLAVP